jgi:hypothetical protein
MGMIWWLLKSYNVNVDDANGAFCRGRLGVAVQADGARQVRPRTTPPTLSFTTA